MKKNVITGLLILISYIANGQNLKLSKEVPLIEPDTLIIASVYKIDYSKKIDKNVITDYQGNQILIADPNTGRITKIFNDFQKYSDSLANNLNQNIWGIYDGNYFLSYKEAVDKYHMYKTYKEAKRWLEPQVKDAVFYNNELIISMSLRCFGFKVDNDTITSVYTQNEYSLLTFDIKNYKLKKFILINQLKENCKNCTFRPNPLIFLSKDTLIGLYESMINYISNNKKETYTVGTYSLSTNKAKGLALLPEEYYKSHLAYYLLDTYIDVDKNNDIYVSYALLPYITNINKQEKYYLSNLGNKNKHLLDSLKNVKDLNKYNIIKEYYKLRFPFIIKSVNSTNYGFLIIWQENNSKEQKTKAHISLYDNKFNFRKDFVLEMKTDKGAIENIFYMKNINSILVVRKHKEKGFLFQSYKISK